TPTTPTLPDDFVFDNMENWALTPPSSTVPRDNYKIEIHKDASDVPGLFSKDRKTITSAELVDYYATNN
ncbi:16965_t:CDS:2, partial [Cetraspora pellucida]